MKRNLYKRIYKIIKNNYKSNLHYYMQTKNSNFSKTLKLIVFNI